MKRYLIELSFDGTAYHGWQVQNNAVTVQSTVQDAVEAVYGRRLDITGCSRTDSGVHAEMFCFHMDAPALIPADRLPFALNVHLPSDIVVTGCKEVAPDFHARYQAKGKQYCYHMYDSEHANPFLDRFSFYHKGKLDENLLNKAAQSYLGKHDFSAFCASGSSVEDHVRTVFEAKVERIADEVVFSVTADGFLYNMVRIMAGTLMEVAEGSISVDDLSEIIGSKDRSKSGRTAAARGLHLKKVLY